jgi:hypothetical protein
MAPPPKPVLNKKWNIHPRARQTQHRDVQEDGSVFILTTNDDTAQWHEYETKRRFNTKALCFSAARFGDPCCWIWAAGGA